MDEKQGMFQAVEKLDGLLGRLDTLVSFVDASLKQSTESLAILRGKVNNQLYSGTVTLIGTPGSWYYNADFVVDFASVAWADTQGNGPFVISTDGSGATTGPGTINTFAGGKDAGRVPLIGKHLSITSTSQAAGPLTLFIAVFTDTGAIRIVQ